MTEQEYMKLTQKVKLASALQLLGELASYGSIDDIDELVKAIRLLERCHSNIEIEIKED
tara:strand:- start:156 stop:332 length:177 start_codon:yes stop_codon:yes gene_type:complete